MENWTNLLKAVLYHDSTSNEFSSFISYRESGVQLDQSKYEYVMSNLSEKWTNDAEKLIRFDVRLEKNSGTVKYYVEVQKNSYDFRIREYRKTTVVRTPTDEECEDLYKKFTEFFNKFYVEQYTNLYDNILNSISNKSFVSLKLIEMRNTLLKQSDVYMLPDFPISDEDRQKVIEYRQQLRDITNQDGWPNDLENIQIPVSPIDHKKQVQTLNDYLFDSGLMDSRLKNLGIDLLNSNIEETIKNYTSISMKMNILSTLYNLKIPMFVEQNNGSFEEILNSAKASYEKFNDYFALDNINNTSDEELRSNYEQLTNELNTKVDLINETMKSYDLNFTIDDIIKDIIKQREIQTEAENIIDNLEMNDSNTQTN